MSHGAGTDDFETYFRQRLPKTGNVCRESVMFLFEAPGTDPGEDQRRRQTYEDIEKCPPTTYYYWMHKNWPSGSQWPRSPEEAAEKTVVSEDRCRYGWGYGFQIAYLIFKFGLSEAYVTNVVKCSLTKHGSARALPCGSSKLTRGIEDHCTEIYLKRELEIQKPN
jgi:hypothetical protein